MLKVACGIYFSIASKDREKLSKTHHIDMQRVHRAFFAGERDARGVSIFARRQGALSPSKAMSLLHLLPVTTRTIRGFPALGSLFGDSLWSCCSTNTAANPGPWTALVRRPTELVLKPNRRQHVIFLSWPSGAPEGSVTMECPQAPRVNSKSI
jgi:hypothetical protein